MATRVSDARVRSDIANRLMKYREVYRASSAHGGGMTPLVRGVYWGLILGMAYVLGAQTYTRVEQVLVQIER